MLANSCGLSALPCRGFEARISPATSAGASLHPQNLPSALLVQASEGAFGIPQEPLIPRPIGNSYPFASVPSSGRFREHFEDDSPSYSLPSTGSNSQQQSSSEHPRHIASPSIGSVLGSPGPSVPATPYLHGSSSSDLLASVRRFRQNSGGNSCHISKENIGSPQPTDVNPFSLSGSIGEGSHPGLHPELSPAEATERPANRRDHSTGSVTSAIRSLFSHNKKKSGDILASGRPLHTRKPSHLRQLSKSISKWKLRSKSDPTDKRINSAFVPERREVGFYHSRPTYLPSGAPHPLALNTLSAPQLSQTRFIRPSQILNARLSQGSSSVSQESLLPPVPDLPRRTRDYSEAKTRFPKLKGRIMDPTRTSRFLDPTSAMAAITKHKAEAIKLAKEQATAVQEMCRRAKTETPPYEFEELIGKGSYGRVYKGHQLPSRKVVAIKVMDIDSMDYKSLRDFKDESIKDFIHETKVMKQVKDAGAKNINELIEAISIHSQLWLVCEYCPGGSVRTLMRATGDRLDEKFLIPVARELAAGLRAIHDAGIIHRDIKAANVLIHEEGHLQICDFGVAGVLQSQKDKRSTWIGTPHWMPPEMFSTRGEAHKYGSEIDVWAYGCTLFEFATGNPPNSNLRERMQIGRQLNRTTPKLDNVKYSDGLKNLVSFALESNPATRPSMADILLHPYIADSEEIYPTSSLRELVRIYYQWSQRGGQRISLFHPGGAAAAEVPGLEPDFEEDWNFSTTDGFERRFSVIDLDQVAASLAEMEREDSPAHSVESDSNEEPVQTAMTEEDKANFDERVRRGAEAMEGLFNEEKPSYKYETKNDFVPVEPKPPVSDLPLRMETDRSSVTSTFIDIDIGSFDSSHYAAGATSAQPFQLADADTIKANRSSGRQQRNSNEARSRSSSSDVHSNRESVDMTYQPQNGPRPPTMDWKFPVFMQPATEEASKAEVESPKQETPEPDLSGRRATMEWTFPVMTSNEQGSQENAGDYNRYSTLRAPLTALQEPSTTNRPSSIGEPGDSRPSTSTSGKSSISASSDTDYDPFRFDRPSTPPNASTEHARSSSNEFPVLELSDYSDPDRSSVLDGPGPDEEDEPVEENHSVSHSEPFPTAIPSRAPEANAPFPTIDEIPMSEPLPTARRDPPSSIASMGPIQFPELLPPRLEQRPQHDF
ncbi:hypothetical protein BJX96DRAFT_187953 [Aspergillus floccosus]